MTDSRPVAVAGANGKTTTTSMLTVALQAAGSRPVVRLRRRAHRSGHQRRMDRGAASSSSRPTRATAPSSSTAPRSPSSPTCSPTTSTSTAPSRRSRRPMPSSPRSLRAGGLLVACADDAGSRRLAARRGGVGHPGPHLRLRPSPRTCACPTTAPTTRASARRRPCTCPATASARRCASRRPGRHNALNAAAAYLAATEGFGADPRRVLEGLAGFDGARRRFEVRGEVAGVTVVDDYAHNPGKVAAVVATAADIAARRGGRLHVAFQPHLYSRTRDFAEGFAAGLAPADTVVLLDVYGAREQPMEGVTSELIAAPLRDLPGDADASPSAAPSRRPRAGAGRARDARATSSSPSAPATSPTWPPSCSTRCGGGRSGERRGRLEPRFAAGRPRASASGPSSAGADRGGGPCGAGPCSSWRPLVWLAFWSPVLAVRSVQVSGVTGADRTAVVDLVGVEEGTPLAGSTSTPSRSGCAPAAPSPRSPSSAAGRPPCASAPCSRQPALVLKNPQGQLEVVDSTGVSYDIVTAPPAGIPVVTAASTKGTTKEALEAALSVVRTLPPDLGRPGQSPSR